MILVEQPELTPEQIERRDVAIKNHNNQMHEKKIHAEKREAEGKDPKVSPGDSKVLERDKMMMGCLADNIMGQIRLAEVVMGKTMFFTVGIPTRDGRVVTITVEAAPTNSTDSPVQ